MVFSIRRAFHVNSYRLMIRSIVFRDHSGERNQTALNGCAWFKKGASGPIVLAKSPLAFRGRRRRRGGSSRSGCRRNHFRRRSIARRRVRALARFGRSGLIGRSSRIRRHSSIPAGLGPAFAGIIVHIPTRTLKPQRRRRHRANQFPLAFGTFRLRLGAETLNLFKGIAARGAAIFVQWQGKSSE
jgi:hypothetical protein